MYKRQIYQIAESNRIEKNRFGSENRIESKLFARIGMLYPVLVLPPRSAVVRGSGASWRVGSSGVSYKLPRRRPDASAAATAAAAGRLMVLLQCLIMTGVCVCRPCNLMTDHAMPCQPASRARSLFVDAVSLSHATARRQHPAQRASCTRLMALVMFTSAATLLLRLR